MVSKESAEKLSEGTNGETSIHMPACPVYLVRFIDVAMIDAKRKALDDNLHAVKINRNTAMLSCIQHSIPALEKLADGFVPAKERLDDLLKDNDIDRELLEYAQQKAELQFMRSANVAGGATKNIQFQLSKKEKNHIGAYARNLGLPDLLAVPLSIANVMKSQGHLAADAYRRDAEELIERYSRAVEYAKKSILRDYECLLEDKKARIDSREGKST
jgi:hypothetical protein